MTDRSERETDTNLRTQGSSDSSAEVRVALECQHMPESCRPLFRMFARRLDAMEARITKAEGRLNAGDRSLDELTELVKLAREMDRKITVLETRFAIIWAGLGVIGTVAVGGIVTGVIALLGGGVHKVG